MRGTRKHANATATTRQEAWAASDQRSRPARGSGPRWRTPPPGVARPSPANRRPSGSASRALAALPNELGGHCGSLQPLSSGKSRTMDAGTATWARRILARAAGLLLVGPPLHQRSRKWASARPPWRGPPSGASGGPPRGRHFALLERVVRAPRKSANSIVGEPRWASASTICARPSSFGASRYFWVSGVPAVQVGREVDGARGMPAHVVDRDHKPLSSTTSLEATSEP